MATEYLHIRVNKELKDSFTAVCKKKGVKSSIVIRLFAKNFNQTGKLNYDFNKDRKFNDLNDVRVSYRMESSMRESLSANSEKMGLTMSVVIRGYMDACVTSGKLLSINL